MSYSIRCLKFVVLSFTVIFGVSGLSLMVFSVVNLVSFHSHDDFIPRNVTAPVMMLAITGLVVCLVAALGWHTAMNERAIGLYMFSAFLIVIIFSEFGGAVWALISRGNFEDEMTTVMEQSFSSYTTDNSVPTKWKSLQKQLQCCGINGPSDYRQAGIDWSCCLPGKENEESCHTLSRKGCPEALIHDVEERLLMVSLLSIATAIGQIFGVFCSFCLSNAVKSEVRRSRLSDGSASTVIRTI